MPDSLTASLAYFSRALSHTAKVLASSGGDFLLGPFQCRFHTDSTASRVAKGGTACRAEKTGLCTSARQSSSDTSSLYSCCQFSSSRNELSSRLGSRISARRAGSGRLPVASHISLLILSIVSMRLTTSPKDLHFWFARANMLDLKVSAMFLYWGSYLRHSHRSISNP